MSGTYLLVLPWELSAIGGVSQVVAGLYDGIRAEGSLTPRVLVLTWGATEPTEETDAAGRCILRFRVRSPVGEGSAAISLFRYVLRAGPELYRLHRFLRRYDVRVINTHYIGASDAGWAVAKAVGILRGRLFLSLHGRDIRTIAARRGLARAIWSWTLRRADALVACSDGLADETRRMFGLGPDRVVTIHNGVDAARLAARAAQAVPSGGAEMAGGGPQVLNLGTFEHKKGHDVLLRAFARVAAQHPTAKLTIMGRTAEAREATFRLAAELKLGARVALRPDVPHATALAALKAADVFVLASRNEAFSVALLEAGALGKAVVATNVCGVPELIRDDDTGIVVENEDERALAAALLKMLNSEPLRAACGQRLRRLVLERFTLEATCRAYLRLAGADTR